MSPPAAAPRSTVSDKRVLLVDDDRIVRRVIRRQLLALNLRVTEAGGVEQALEKLESNEPFDLLFTDWSMPGLPVGVLIEGFRSSLPEARIVVSSGLAKEEMDADQQTWDAILSKPFSIDELRTVIHFLLG